LMANGLYHWFIIFSFVVLFIVLFIDLLFY
jgi:hypothetical protein